MQVKDLIQSKVSLAPMAGITDYVLRSLIREHSKTCLLTTEMISSEALTQVKDTDIVEMGTKINLAIEKYPKGLRKRVEQYQTENIVNNYYEISKKSDVFWILFDDRKC